LGLFIDTEHYYYSTSGHILEVRKEASLGWGIPKSTAYKQFVYQLYYIDAVLVRYWVENEDGDLAAA